ncbi:PREDICTED: sodium-independent sulfate anion transporter-like [Rhagoletis zephyria]|uniref:sodium-independent sulfate anion transporter-like n=1 Tax=Rhagoletis zephyria TaxID=28612 RepID=UPI00081136B4|nr:PREDICTED: sodium-independent sulfate anion transporter-like [Rhagoletis zephyria]
MTSYDKCDNSAKSQMLPQDATQIIMESAKPFTSEALRRSSTPHTAAGKVKKALRNRLEILNWIGDYNTEWAMSDLIAGITLGLTIIPESIACALLAGLPARYGLCSAFLGSFVYLIFGSINKVIIGPTSLVALVSLQFTVGKPIEFAILLTFLTGVVELIMGTLRVAPKGMVDANKELITVGLCNLAGSCVQSMPVSGAFSRYAISNACGLRTPMANLYLGVIVLLALGFLSPYFNYIPESTLAAILMCSIVTLLDLQLPRRLWRDAKRDFCVWVLCFTVCILCGVEVGLLVSIIVTVLHLLFLWAHPVISVHVEEVNELQFIRVTPTGVIYFPAINHLRAKVLKACERVNFSLPVVMDCHKIAGIDFTAAQGISKLPDDLTPSEVGSGPLLIIYRLEAEKQKLIQATDKLIFCNDDVKLEECITQESLRNGNFVMKEPMKSTNSLLGETHLDLHY